jgi:hypothetical protein
MNKPLTMLGLYLAGASMSAFAAVYELPADVAALFVSAPVGTKVWLINEPVKIAYVDRKLLMEVHPPVDGEGQTATVDLEVMSQKLRRALGPDTGAIHWDFTLKALEAATGVPTIVGLPARTWSRQLHRYG